MKIVVLHCGGTISCEEKNGALTPSASIEPYFKALETREVSFIHRRISPFLSEYLNGSHIESIVDAVSEALAEKSVGGVIVTHGSDTIAYTSAALGYALGLCSVPVVTVCADLPLSDPRSSGHMNIRAAIAVITSGEASGALTVYASDKRGATVLRATRILRHRAYEARLTGVSEPYGKTLSIAPEKQIFLKNRRYAEYDDALSPLPFRASGGCPVAYITVTPAMLLPDAPLSGTKAVILGSYHSGTVDTASTELIRFLSVCRERDIPVFVDGIGACADYESMLAYKALGLTRLPPLVSPVAMYMKLWMMLENGISPITGAIERSLGGDIPPSWR